MSQNELNRLHLIQKHLDGLMTLREVALILGLSVRQVKRIKKGIMEHGPASLPHGNRGCKPHHALPEEALELVLTLASSIYQGYNFHHLRDMLEERHNLKISVSSVRRILLQYGLKSPKKRRSPKRYRNRPRRQRMGELVQIDASPFRWLGKDQPMLSLVAAIDDATGKILGAAFRPSEDFWGYAMIMYELISTYGIPENIYSDRHTIFQSPKAEKLSLEDELAGMSLPLTQFGRCLASLNIIHTFARSPQAKGRIERLWETLQDRLTKEMALAGIKTLKQDNAFLRSYIPKFNARFSVKAASEYSAFKPAPDHDGLLLALTKRENRKVDNGSSISFKGLKFRLLDHNGQVLLLKKGTSISIVSDLEGLIRACYRDQIFNLQPVQPQNLLQETIPKDEHKVAVSKLPAPTNHPWKKWNPDYFHYHPTTDSLFRGDIF